MRFQGWNELFRLAVLRISCRILWFMQESPSKAFDRLHNSPGNRVPAYVNPLFYFLCRKLDY
jgi:hypothetical protein